MRQFGDVVVQIYLFLALLSGAIGLTDGVSTILGLGQAWFSFFVGTYSLVWFVATIFFVSLFRKYQVGHIYYILPTFYLVSYSLLTFASLVVSYYRFNWSWLILFFVSASFAASLVELFFAGFLLRKLSVLKKHVKLGTKKFSI